MSMVNVRNLGFGGTGVPDALPQAIAELQGMKMTVVNGAAAGTVMPVPGMDPEDTIGALIDLTALADVAVSTATIQARNASGTITCLTTAVENDFVTVNGKNYVWKDVIVNNSYNAPPGVVAVDITPSGCDAEKAAKALATAIMSGDSTVTTSVGPDASSPPKLVVVTVRVRNPGTAGNSYTLTETGVACTVSGATFTGGLSTASAGFVSTVNLAAKKILVVWYDKRPGVATSPLMLEPEDDEEGGTLTANKLKAMRFRGGRKEDDPKPSHPIVGGPSVPTHPIAPGGPNLPTGPGPSGPEINPLPGDREPGR